MIDPTTETTFPLTHINRHTSLRNHVATYFRWARAGVRGIRLETIKIGRQTHTSKTALLRFFASLSGPRQGYQSGRAPDAGRQAEVATQLARKFGL